MRNRLVSVLAIVGVLGAATVAEAATGAKVKPVCHLITDPKGDSTLSPTGGGGVPGDATSDVVSADIASNAKTLTAVIRLAGLQNPDPESPLGMAYYVDFTAPGDSTLYFLTARLYPTGNHFFFGYEGSDPILPLNTLYAVTEGTGVVDTAKGEVHISVPLSAIAKTVKLAKGEVLSGLTATSYRIFGQGVVPSQNVGPARAPVGGLSEQMDTAVSRSTYTLGQASCVKVGK
jgi:hypothetical protein